MSSATIVVPCYNEGSRLDEAAFAGLVVAHGLLDLLFVNDGSKDNTAECLARLQARAPGRIRILGFDRNKGKAEAVRRGLLAALDAGAEIVGYYDADLATPTAELVRLIDVMQTTHADVLLASRVLLLGRAIERSNVGHYLGRVFATAASLTLGVAVYDTQCGAKLLRRTPQLTVALTEPFLSRWAFDVELLGRLLAGSRDVPGLSVNQLIEEPLLAWRDIPGSKLRPRHMVGAALDMGRIAIELKCRRRAAQAGASI
jgi:glycosyltransferase involved in cell wall biosynthesis